MVEGRKGRVFGFLSFVVFFFSQEWNRLSFWPLGFLSPSSYSVLADSAIGGGEQRRCRKTNKLEKNSIFSLPYPSSVVRGERFDEDSNMRHPAEGGKGGFRRGR